MPTDPPPIESQNLLFEPERLPEDHRSGFIALIGRPNVGKSTLLNRLMGQKIAITSSKPQTTRDQIMGILTTEDTQFIFLDTPGIHKPKHKLGAYMVAVAEETIAQDADLVLWLVDANVSPTREDRLIGEWLQEIQRRSSLPTLIVGLNKVDQWSGDPDSLDRRRTEYLEFIGELIQDDHQGEMLTVAHTFSALSGDSVEALLALIRAMLPLGPRYFPPDQVTDLQMRFIVAELIREEALNHLEQEVPHALAVVVDEFKERDDNMTYIAAIIYVERLSQKKIVLGQGGAMIREIGKAARPQIEELVETKVYLDLWVKVWANWRKKEGRLRLLGYQAPAR